MKKFTALALLLVLFAGVSMASTGAIANRYSFSIYEKDGKLIKPLVNTVFYIGSMSKIVLPGQPAKIISSVIQLKSDYLGSAGYSDTTGMAALQYASKSKDALQKVLNGAVADKNTVIDNGAFIKDTNNKIIFPKLTLIVVPTGKTLPLAK